MSITNKIIRYNRESLFVVEQIGQLSTNEDTYKTCMKLINLRRTMDPACLKPPEEVGVADAIPLSTDLLWT